jgi:hypothetical protein
MISTKQRYTNQTSAVKSTNSYDNEFPDLSK